MWKLVVGFVLFAALSLFVIMQAGDKVDMSGEKQETAATAWPSRVANKKPAQAGFFYGLCGAPSAAELAVCADDGQVGEVQTCVILLAV